MRWPIVSISAVADINPRTKDLATLPDETEVTFVPMSAVSEVTASIVSSDVRTLEEVRRGYTPFQEGDVLFAKITPCMENGKAALATGLLNGIGFGSTEFHVLRSKRVVLPQYLYYLVRQRAFRSAAKQQMRGGVGQQRVPGDFLKTYSLSLPPLSEQRRIVEILDQADALRKRRTEADAKAERILPALFYKMFGDPVTNPKGWPKAKLGDVIIETQYGTSTRANTDGEGVAVLRMNNIDSAGRLDLRDLKYVALDAEEAGKYALEPGDILFNRTNSKELVGKTGLWKGGIEAIPASYLIRVRIDRQCVLPEYVWAYMNTPFMKQVLFDKARRAIGMANINAQELRSLPAIIPNLQVQQSFARILGKLGDLVDLRFKAGSKVEFSFQVLLHRAFSGDLTAKWREAHMKELLAEMEEQAKYLAVGNTTDGRERAELQGSLF